ncbi:DegV family protein [Sedimentibacter sp.]|uniref:DegV family protein n=1 Tax=Sedimentibacter sp. TaxID=1960295 RepID=UPI0028A6CF7E|nr:DegV family protein [Sedimentibacter sp.]
MKNYVIVTDSTADLPVNIIEEYNLTVVPLSYSFENENYINYPDHRQLAIKEFYERIKKGERSTTTLVNAKTFEEYLTPLLEAGNDILYLGFSSPLSGTYGSSLIAREELSEKYTDARIECIDTLAASMGEGLLIYYAAKMKQEGKNLDEVKQWILENNLHLCHWFTVDDLNHLKRGGRINAMTATIGTALGVKPILHVDNGGHLVSVTNVRGRKKSIHALLEQMETTCINPEENSVFISHADCLEDAEYLGNLIKEKLNVKEVVINFIGPVIGSHTGQGALALFFFGKER